MKRSVTFSLMLCACLLALVELALHHQLFRHVSYSNSESIDLQIEERDSQHDWRMIFVGDSETRWGIDPREIDEAFQQKGLMMKSFNHAFDGFGTSWWPRLLPPLLKTASLREVEVVAVGVQLIDSHRMITALGEDCGVLQKPVLTSPFGIDLGVDVICRGKSWDESLGSDLFNGLWTVRYAAAVRSMVLPRSIFAGDGLKFNSMHIGPPRRGFQGHRSISQNLAGYESEFARWKAQYQPNTDFRPLPREAWERLVAGGKFFDQLHEVVKASGRQLVLYALPTNPVVIDTLQRRGDYARNSAMLAEWSKKRGVVFVDLGIQDDVAAGEFFSDMRHLSEAGAKLFSRKLGEKLALEYHQ